MAITLHGHLSLARYLYLSSIVISIGNNIVQTIVPSTVLPGGTETELKPWIVDGEISHNRRSLPSFMNGRWCCIKPRMHICSVFYIVDLFFCILKTIQHIMYIEYLLEEEIQCSLITSNK